ncbi:hypothetical protein ACFQVD_26860 [Streptosporangium amethystogenes subsp. fukuiense]|uniref:Uncharacterized protein n=1 Tax=Streptosporangium amethystogenes subsp. fukuiense TaxID=698418 RepID=A0ABW2T6G5_9ACTN
MNELALTESPALRAQYADHVEVLDKVKALTFFPDGIHVDGPGVAAYYEVPVETIKKVAQRNRKELEEHGMRVLRGKEYREFAKVNTVITEGGDILSLAPSQNTVTTFTRRTILNIGQMLTGSEISKAVRKRLLDLEEEARQRALALLRVSPEPVAALLASEPFTPKTFPLAEVVVLIKQRFGVRISVADLKEKLRQAGAVRQDDRPMRKYEALFWHTGESGKAYEVFGHQIEAVYRLYESTKLRLELAAQRALPLDPPGWPELPLGEAS